MSAYDDFILALPGLVVYWKAENLIPPSPPPNSEFFDSGPGGFNGTLQPNSVGGLVQGLVGPILTDGTSYGMGGGLARIPSLGDNTGALFQTGAQTWLCWFQHDGLGNVYTLMNRGGDTTNTYLCVNQPRNGAVIGAVVFSLDWGDAGRLGLASCQVTPNEWHVAHGTYDGIDTMQLFVDTWLSATRSDCPPAPLTDTNPWRIGYIPNVVFGATERNYEWSHGAVVSRVLTNSEIIQTAVVALGSRPANPCGGTLEVFCPLTTGSVGTPYTSTIQVINGTAPFTFALISGALPTGLVLNTSTGEISGTPTTAGTFNFVIEVTDADMLTADTPGCGIVIDETPPPPPVVPNIRTVRFDQGLGASWYIIPQLSDSGEELRDKNVKSFYAIGKMTAPQVSYYGYGPQKAINVSDMEEGINSNTGKKSLSTTTQVTQRARKQLNMANVTQHTCRLEGVWDGTGEKDRVDKMVYEQAIQGVRR